MVVEAPLGSAAGPLALAHRLADIGLRGGVLEDEACAAGFAEDLVTAMLAGWLAHSPSRPHATTCDLTSPGGRADIEAHTRADRAAKLADAAAPRLADRLAAARAIRCRAPIQR